jgi:hypothetical protein
MWGMCRSQTPLNTLQSLLLLTHHITQPSPPPEFHDTSMSSESTSEPVRTGACLCKSITFRVVGPEMNFAIYHCTNCRRNCGTTYTANAWFHDKVRKHQSFTCNRTCIQEPTAFRMDNGCRPPKAIRRSRYSDRRSRPPLVLHQMRVANAD